MLQTLMEMFSYSFMSRALIVGIPVSLCAALLGVSLVLKRYSMIGDGLSHVGFGALAIAAALNLAPVLAAFLLLRLSENSKIKGDAAIAIISSSALAIGVIVATLNKGMNTDLNNYLFGSILATTPEDAVFSVVLSVIVILLFVLFYHKIFAVTFDENFAKATGTRANLYNLIIALLTALTIVVGMRIMGTLLISSLIIFPSLTSMRLCKTFKTVVVCSAVLSVLCFVVGITASFLYETPTGASIVAANIIAFLLFWMIGFFKRKFYTVKL